jgi:hypothetical protein
MQVPYSDLPSQTARSQDLIGRWVEGQTPGGAGMAPQDVEAFTCRHIRYSHRVVTMGGGHFSSEIYERIYNTS